MFNAMDTGDLLVALADVLRDAGRIDRPLSGFERSQLLSASSIARNLAAEERGTAATLQAANDAVAAAVAAAAAEIHPAPFRQARDGRELGEQLGALLEGLRRDERTEAQRLRTRLQGVLRRLADDEVAALAAGAGR
ncbi:hypothetical protein PAI11_01250 [Patulibacter medicamentivorans]|uniref:Uncharacterized protein n=1 Tax=Patulibacter medicamentivorans TaxID=1097667 RepID=H0E020_9ACTN|nr:hypothetical protein [Patulibacter medicamentivorans]EHN12979.1 hypothetical protein PAI11_01250 [Patulibacter medicamentivorans]